MRLSPMLPTTRVSSLRTPSSSPMMTPSSATYTLPAHHSLAAQLGQVLAAKNHRLGVNLVAVSADRDRWKQRYEEVHRAQQSRGRGSNNGSSSVATADTVLPTRRRSVELPCASPSNEETTFQGADRCRSLLPPSPFSSLAYGQRGKPPPSYGDLPGWESTQVAGQSTWRRRRGGRERGAERKEGSATAALAPARAGLQLGVTRAVVANRQLSDDRVCMSPIRARTKGNY